MEENNTIDLQNMLFEVAKQKRDYILNESECGTKENSQATEEFIKCMNVYRDLQKDTDDTYLEQQRVNNEIETNRKAEKQKERFDWFRIGMDGATLLLTGVGLYLSFKTLEEYQEINLNTVITNRDAVKAADNLFSSMFRRIS